jgi:hypothetical protein
MAVLTHHAGLRFGPPYRLTDSTNVLYRPQCPLRIGREKQEVLFTHYLVSLLQLFQRYVSFMVQRFAVEGGYFGSRTPGILYLSQMEQSDLILFFAHCHSTAYKVHTFKVRLK